MAKPNETQNTQTTGPVQYRVNFQHVAPNFQLRGGSLIVEAATVAEANEKALSILRESNFRNYRLTITKPY